MHKNELLSVDYASSIHIHRKYPIRMKISNDYGYVKDVRAKFNRRGEKPGSEKTVSLHYNHEESTSNYSVFVGSVSFDTLGYRTFIIECTINDVKKIVAIKPKSYEEQLVDSGKDVEYSFFECFAYAPTFSRNERVVGGIMYQIYVDTFCAKEIPKKFKGKVVEWIAPPKWMPDSDGEYRNNQFYGGNIRGIIDKLDYIKQLNITVIYLTPIFSSPSSNRYDISDYTEIDEMVGTWNDVDELREECHKRGMDLVQDIVPNHSSIENVWVTTAPEMYGANPTYWWGFKHLIEFDKYSNLYYENMKAVLELYDQHFDGIRIDVADNMPDVTLQFIRKHFSKYILAEIWKDAVTGEFRGFLYGDEVDGVMNYRFSNAIYKLVRWKNAEAFYEIVHRVCSLYPPEALDNSPIFVTSHDIPRVPNIVTNEKMPESGTENVWDVDKDPEWGVGDDYDTVAFRKWSWDHRHVPEEYRELAFDLQGLVVFLEYTLPGLPSIFAGDEAGVEGLKDPFNRRTFPWGNIDEKRFELYRDIGEFRISNKSTFEDSTNFKIVELTSDIVVFTRGEFIFAANITDKPVDASEFLEGYEVVYKLRKNEPINNGIITGYQAISAMKNSG